jgi:hypothetical protein
MGAGLVKTFLYPSKEVTFNKKLKVPEHIRDFQL